MCRKSDRFRLLMNEILSLEILSVKEPKLSARDITEERDGNEHGNLRSIRLLATETICRCHRVLNRHSAYVHCD